MLRPTPARKNSEGYTFVEVLVSLVIVMIVFVGLTETGLITIEMNIRNTLRDEAVHVAEQELSALRATSFAGVVSQTRPDISRQVRGLTVVYRSNWAVTDLNGTNKQVAVMVTWTRKGKNYAHQAITIVRNG